MTAQQKKFVVILIKSMKFEITKVLKKLINRIFAKVIVQRLNFEKSTKQV